MGLLKLISFVDTGPNLEITALCDIFEHRMDRCRDELKKQRGLEASDQNCFLGFDNYKKVIDSGLDAVPMTHPVPATALG